MASDFKRTDIPNLDKHEVYGTYYGRVKLRGKLVRESFGDNKRVAMEKLTGWLVNLRGAKRVKHGTLNSLTERYLIWLSNAEASGDINEETEVYKQECVKAIRNLCKLSNITEGKVLDFLQETGSTDGSVTSLEELAMYSGGSTIKTLHDQWQDIAAKIKSVGGAA